MDLNSIIEIGSKANIILRFRGATTLNGKTYLENEPYLFLKDVVVVIGYSNEDKAGRTDKTVVAFSDIKPRTVQVGNITFSRKIASLLSTYQNEGQSYNATAADEVTASGGAVYLTKTIDYLSDYFVYDSNFDIVADVTEGLNNSLESVNFVDDEEYIVFYSSVSTGTIFDLNKPHIPYMSMEVQGIGNIDKNTKNVLMYFEKVSLNALMEFTFMQDKIINVPLVFHIIDNQNNYIVYED